MAEITKISAPLIPKENIGNKYKPNTDQAFELTDLNKIHKSAQDGAKIGDHQRPDGQALRDSIGRASIAALLKDTGSLTTVIQRLAMLVETGFSTAELMADPHVKMLLESLFVPQQQMAEALMEQDKSSVLFKGEAFNVLRDLLTRFEGNPKVQGAVAGLLKAFEYNVNSGNAVRTILANCENILDYLFSQDRQQFGEYLNGLAQTLLPEEPQTSGKPPMEQAAPQEQSAPMSREGQPQVSGNAQQAAAGQEAGVAAQESQAAGAQEGAVRPDGAQAQGAVQAEGTIPEQEQMARMPEEQTQGAKPGQVNPEKPELALPQKEVAQILKSNLLPLLGEIVVKYNQNERIRDHVMVVVHNTVRVDQGTPEALRESVNRLVQELRQVANVPESFSRNLTEAMIESGRAAKAAGNQVLEKLVNVVSEALRSENSSPAVIRQAETLLMSMLQNQSVMMDVLHFIVPIQAGNDQMIAELYVDPDSEERSGRGGDEEKSRKLFLSFESQLHGSYEMSFVQTGEHVDFSMWCPGALVHGLSGMKRHFADIMQTYGYTMNSFSIEEYKRAQSVAEVFPNLLNRRVGIDVRI